MGVWGTGNFENDTALDLVAELMETEEGAAILVSSLQATANIPAGETLDSDDAVETLVAAEFLAAALGVASDDFPEEAAEWLAQNDLLAADSFIGGPREEKIKWLSTLALRAIERIHSGDSELDELWEESDEYEEWLATLDELKARLTKR